MIISKTPYRVSLFGGGSDHPAWFKENGGKVVSLAINRFCYISARILPPFFEHNFRIAYSRVETVREVSNIEHPVVRECIRKYLPKSRLEIHHDGDLPARSGIGSSSAFTVGMINSLLALKGISIYKRELANEAIAMEYKILQENVGWQDQIACSLGGLNSITFGPKEEWTHKSLEISKSREKEICSRMVLLFTGVSRNSSQITAGLINSIESKSRKILRMMEMVSEFEHIVTSNDDLDHVGYMLHESWELKKSTNSLASTDTLDAWYKRGIEAGALGGKVLGAGGGGFMLFWVKEHGKEKFLEKFGAATFVPFEICHNGATIIYNDQRDLGDSRDV